VDLEPEHFNLAKHPFSSLNFGHMSNSTTPQVGILMGSDSDWPTMKLAADALSEFGVSCEAKVISAHRDPHGLDDYAGSAVQRGLKVIIAGQGARPICPASRLRLRHCQ
jgi:5-(carboxyamino)imidazole ribonucleotide mutase